MNEISISTSLEQQIANLTSVVQQLALGGTTQVIRCGICSKNGHPTDSCPTLYEEVVANKLMLWEDSKAKMGFKGSTIPSLILIIRGREITLILAMERINK